MVIIDGEFPSLILEENLIRFLEIMEWINEHSCSDDKRIILSVKIGGEIKCHSGFDGSSLKLGDSYNYTAYCRSCGEKKISLSDV